jgi:rhodanese-related sulfurtransferase
MLEFWADPSSPYHRDEFQPERRVILHCASGGRSALAAQTLQELGYSNVAHMDGGITAWNDSGRPVAHEHDFGHSGRLSGSVPTEAERPTPPKQW